MSALGASSELDSATHVAKLHQAIDENDVSATLKLIQLGANCFEEDDEGCHALNRAIKYNNTETALALIKATKELGIAHQLFTKTTSLGATALHLAAANLNLDIVKALLDVSVPISHFLLTYKNKIGDTAKAWLDRRFEYVAAKNDSQQQEAMTKVRHVREIKYDKREEHKTSHDEVNPLNKKNRLGLKAGSKNIFKKISLSDRGTTVRKQVLDEKRKLRQIIPIVQQETKELLDKIVKLAELAKEENEKLATAIASKKASLKIEDVKPTSFEEKDPRPEEKKKTPPAPKAPSHAQLPYLALPPPATSRITAVPPKQSFVNSPFASHHQELKQELRETDTMDDDETMRSSSCLYGYEVLPLDLYPPGQSTDFMFSPPHSPMSQCDEEKNEENPLSPRGVHRTLSIPRLKREGKVRKKAKATPSKEKMKPELELREEKSSEEKAASKEEKAKSVLSQEAAQREDKTQPVPSPKAAVSKALSRSGSPVFRPLSRTASPLSIVPFATDPVRTSSLREGPVLSERRPSTGAAALIFYLQEAGQSSKQIMTMLFESHFKRLLSDIMSSINMDLEALINAKNFEEAKMAAVAQVQKNLVSRAKQKAYELFLFFQPLASPPENWDKEDLKLYLALTYSSHYIAHLIIFLLPYIVEPEKLIEAHHLPRFYHEPYKHFISEIKTIDFWALRKVGRTIERELTRTREDFQHLGKLFRVENAEKDRAQHEEEFRKILLEEYPVRATCRV